MAIELVNMNEVTFKNSKLQRFTEQIFKQGLNIKKSFARIAVTLAQIEDSKCYEMDGFESTADYAEKILGIKYVQTRALIRVGREFIDSKSLESVLPHDENKDYTTTQLQALLPLGTVSYAQELAEDEKINPYMTVKEIKEVVKNELHPHKESEESDESEENATSNDVADVDAYKLEFSIEFGTDKNGNAVCLCGDELMTITQAHVMIDDWFAKVKF